MINQAESNEPNRKMIKIKRKEPKDGEDQAESDEPNRRMIKIKPKVMNQTEPKDDKNQMKGTEGL